MNEAWLDLSIINDMEEEIDTFVDPPSTGDDDIKSPPLLSFQFLVSHFNVWNVLVLFIFIPFSWILFLIVIVMASNRKHNI